MSLTNHLRIAATLAFLATLSVTSALASDCTATPIKADNGNYLHCEVIHGTDIQFQDAESTSEEACALVCSSISELDQVAAESRALDEAAGVGLSE